MDIQRKKVSEINPAVYNPRKDLQPSDPEYEKLKKSILEFDMVEPLVWNKGTGNLVGGHQRLKILKELGLHYRDANCELINVDDERLGPIWEEAGQLGRIRARPPAQSGWPRFQKAPLTRGWRPPFPRRSGPPRR